MAHRAVVMLASLLALSGCATYDYNLQHARVSPDAKLSRAEIEQVVRTVTQKSHLMIIGVTRRAQDGHDRVVVYTELSEPPMMVYELEKSADGVWRIVEYGYGHILVL